MKNWKTTLATVIGSGLIVVGLIWPDQVDAETQEVLKSAFNEILTGVGILVNFITGLLANDPE